MSYRPMSSKGPCIKDVRKIFGIFNPPPPFVHISRNLSELFVHKIKQSPLSVDVLNGSPLLPFTRAFPAAADVLGDRMPIVPSRTLAESRADFSARVP